MDKNWLIRTQSNHIFGPISVAKVRELIKNKSLKPHDEICSGNGFWFFVKERELVEKFVFKELPQPFNPISEAIDVDVSRVLKGALSSEDDIQYPSSEDLEYPDVEEGTGKIINSNQRKNYNEEHTKEATSNLEETGFFSRNQILDNKYPNDSELEFPDKKNNNKKS